MGERSLPLSPGRLAALLLLIQICTGAASASAVAIKPVAGPPGSPLVLEPPAGFAPARHFTGFVNPTTGASIVIALLPTQAFTEVDQGLTAEILANRGLLGAERQVLATRAGDGLLVTGLEERPGGQVRTWMLLFPTGRYTGLVTVSQPLAVGGTALDDATARAILASVKPVTLTSEQMVAALPFTFKPTDDLKLQRTLPGNTAVFAAQSPTPGITAPFAVAVMALDHPPPDMDAETFATATLQRTARLQNVVVDSVTDRRLAGTPGVEILAHAQDDQTGQPLAVAQWLALLPDGYARVIGISPADDFPLIFLQLRQLAASIQRK
jgi:hypothetical protein